VSTGIMLLEGVMGNLNDYTITAVEKEPGKWQGELRRKDGKEMRVHGTTMRVFTTMLASSAGEAMRLAEQAIESNSISPKGWT
jgi:hypothetical protein